MRPRDWRAVVRAVAHRREHPFDGKRAVELLSFAMALSDAAHYTTGDRIYLKALRDEYGDRLTRRYASVLSDARYVAMSVKPARGHLGKPGRAAQYALTLPDVDDNAAPQDAQKGAANATQQRGSVVLSDDTDEGDGVSTTLPPSEHESVTPLVVSGARAFATDTRRLVPLAARRQTWAGWQMVSPRLTPARAA